jgi:Ca2+-binding RTX toxin-like protein
MAGEGSRGDAMGDIYANVENIIGSNFDDIIVLGNARGRIEGLAGNDRLAGGSANDSLSGGNGADMLNGKQGADSLNGGSGSDRFLFTLGDSGQTAAKADVITDFDKGSLGDVIDINVALTIGGSNGSATSGQASINAATGVASFAAGSGDTFNDAISDIARRFTATGDAAGEFALFQVGGTGDHYLFVSDGAAGLTGADVIVKLEGVTTFGSISLTSGDLSLL